MRHQARGGHTRAADARRQPRSPRHTDPSAGTRLGNPLSNHADGNRYRQRSDHRKLRRNADTELNAELNAERTAEYADTSFHGNADAEPHFASGFYRNRNREPDGRAQPA